MAWRVILLPGSVAPAADAFANLLAGLGPGVEAVPTDLAVYAGENPPPDYSLDTEIEALLERADSLGWDRFHLVGYSAGGAVGLALAASHPDRLASLALLEPAWAGIWDDTSPAHRELWPQYERIAALPAEQAMPAFVRLQVLPGVAAPEPPPGPPPSWMARRPAGIRAIVEAFTAHRLDREALARFDRPVYFALGGLSNTDQFREEAERLARVFPDFWLQVFPARHHFDPPHRTESARLATALRSLWQRAESPPPGEPGS